MFSQFTRNENLMSVGAMVSIQNLFAHCDVTASSYGPAKKFMK